MNGDNNLLHQLNPHQQPPLMKKRNNLSWIGLFILLIILHLQFGWGLANIASKHTLNILRMSPFLLAFAIVDYIQVMSYINKHHPPWKVFFIPLLAAHLMVAPLTLSLFAYMGVIGFISSVLPLICILAIIDCIAAYFYRGKQFTPMPDSVVDTLLVIVGIILSGIFTYIYSSILKY